MVNRIRRDGSRRFGDGGHFARRTIRRFGSVAAMIVVSAGLAACSIAGPSGAPGGAAGGTQTGRGPGGTDQVPGSSGGAGPSPGSDSNAGPGSAVLSKQQVIQQIMELAQQGKILNVPFVAGKTTLEEVEQAWGKPDRIDYVAEAKGRYATYAKYGVAMGINKGDQVFELRTSDPAVQQLTLSDIQNVLGIPVIERPLNGQALIGYTAGPAYKLEFIVQPGTHPRVDHVNVLYPQGTINSMADDPGRQW